MKRIRYADSGFRTLKPKIFRIRKSILQQISYFTFIKASQSENYGMYVYNLKKLKNICFTFLSTENDSEGLDIQRLKRLPSLKIGKYYL